MGGNGTLTSNSNFNIKNRRNKKTDMEEELFSEYEDVQ